MRRPLPREAAVTMAATILIASFGLLSAIVTARNMDVDQRGVLLGTVLWAATIGALSGGGLDDALIALSGGRADVARRLRRASARRAVLFGTIGSLAAAAINSYLLRSESPGTIAGAALASIVVVSSTVFTQRNISLIRVNGQDRAWNILRTIPTFTFTATLLCATFYSGLSAPTGIFALAVAGLVTAGITHIATAPVGRLAEKTQCGRAKDLHEMTRYGLQIILAAIPALLTERIDQLMIVLFISPAQLSLYAVGVSLCAVIVSVGTSIGLYIFPILSGAPRDAQLGMARSWLMRTVLVSATLGVALAVVCPAVITIIFGERYGEAVPATRALIPGSIALSAYVVVAAYAKARGRVRSMIEAQTVSMLTTLSLLPIVLPRAGYLGAAFVSSTTYTLALIIIVIRSGIIVPRTRPEAT